jgi:hypothetical protein
MEEVDIQIVDDFEAHEGDDSDLLDESGAGQESAGLCDCPILRYVHGEAEDPESELTREENETLAWAERDTQGEWKNPWNGYDHGWSCESGNDGHGWPYQSRDDDHGWSYQSGNDDHGSWQTDIRPWDFSDY